MNFVSQPPHIARALDLGFPNWPWTLVEVKIAGETGAEADRHHHGVVGAGAGSNPSSMARSCGGGSGGFIEVETYLSMIVG